MNLRWATPALRDIEEIGDYIGQANPTAAERLVHVIFTQTDRLVDHPLLGRVGRVAGTRELVIASTRFIVPYRLKNEQTDRSSGCDPQRPTVAQFVRLTLQQYCSPNVPREPWPRPALARS